MNKKVIAVLLMFSLLLSACSKDEHKKRNKKDREEEETSVETTLVDTTEENVITIEVETNPVETTIEETIIVETTDVVTDISDGDLICSNLNEPYQEVINEICGYINDGDIDGLFESRHVGVGEAVGFNGSEGALESVGVALYDFNNDEMMELFIVSTVDGEVTNILEMYTLGADGNAVMLLGGAERNRYTLMDNMVIRNVASGGWAYTYIYDMTMAPNGESLEVIDAYWSSDYQLDGTTDGNVYWFHSPTATGYEDLEDTAELIGTEIDDELIFPTEGVITLKVTPIGRVC